jgi:hypothetical protein
MNWLETLLPNHPVWDTVILFWLFSAAVNALPTPTDDSSAVYRYIYTFLTTVLGHLSDAINQRRQAAAEKALQKESASS